MTMAGVDGGECDAPFKVTWPEDVDRLKERIGIQIRALEYAVDKCPRLSADDRAAWRVFLSSWSAFSVTETPLFGSHGAWVTACSFAHVVDAWREKLAGKCSELPGPGPIKGADTSAVKWMSTALAAVAVVAVVGGGVYVARMVRG